MSAQKGRDASVYLVATVFLSEHDDGSNSRDVVRVTNVTDAEARAIRDLLIEEPGADGDDILAIAPRAKTEWVR